MLDIDDELTPIECKWTDTPTAEHARHLVTFLKEHRSARRACLVCRTSRRYTVAPRVEAVPWQALPDIVAA